MKILIVEDQRQAGEVLQKCLTERSYTVTCVRTCAEARDALCETDYDVILLDLNLPDGDGLDLLREWRRSKFNEPVLILSARSTVEDRISGLDLGADDYLPKPFSVEELLARVRSMIRRHGAVKESVLTYRGIRLDLPGRTVTVAGNAVDLTGREFALLEIFMHNPQRILTRTFICEKIWESHYDVNTNLLDVYMSKLRSKLESDPGKPLFKTIRAVGYQLL